MSIVILYTIDITIPDMAPTPTPTPTATGVSTAPPEDFTKKSKQPIALKNYLTGEVHYDTLHQEAEKVLNIPLYIYIYIYIYNIWFNMF